MLAQVSEVYQKSPMFYQKSPVAGSRDLDVGSSFWGVYVFGGVLHCVLRCVAVFFLVCVVVCVDLIASAGDLDLVDDEFERVKINGDALGVLRSVLQSVALYVQYVLQCVLQCVLQSVLQCAVW